MGVIKRILRKDWVLMILAIIVFFVIFEFVLFYKLVQIFRIEHAPWVIWYIAISSLFLLSRPIIALFYKDRHEGLVLKNNDTYPSVSFVIAAKNEEDSIYETVASCMQSDYLGFFEMIVVDDGSTDKTHHEMLRAQKDFSKINFPVKVFQFEKNLGKREGMSCGVEHAAGDIVVFVDSDSFLKKNALSHIVEHFLNDRFVGAVSGNTLVENHKENLLTKMQSARYGISFDIFKACESVFGAVTCCPGCFSAYRKDVIDSVIGDWKQRKVFGTKSTFGDDRSLTNFVLRAKWKVEYCRSAIATTIVPDRYKKFMKQQLRWKKSWIREGFFGAAAFMWKKHPIASLSFYTNLIIPIFGPLVVSLGLILAIIHGQWVLALLFCLSVSLMSLAYGFFHYAQTRHKDFMYSVPFTLFYSIILVWQMPWAIIKLNDTGWGTR